MPASRRRLWLDRLTGLWAPLLGFAAAFVVYLVLLECFPRSVEVTRPAICAIAMLATLWWLTLAVLHLAAPSLRRRALRVEARDLLERLTARPGTDALSAQLRSQLEMDAVDPVTLEEADKAVRSPGAGEWLRSAGGLAMALGAALLIRAVLFEPYKIPSGSMLPTLEVGDQIFINKLVYGIHIPFTNRRLLTSMRPPARGDVIVFTNPLDTSRDFIKRVVGIPGDTVELADEVVLINGVPQPRSLRVADVELWTRSELSRTPHRWFTESLAIYDEQLDGRTHYLAQRSSVPRRGIREGPYQVPEGSVFVLGDNRDNSADSRVGFGVSHQVAFVPYGFIQGKAMVIWLSLSHGGVGARWFDGTGLRTDRLFLPVR